MKLRRLLKHARSLANPYRVSDGKGFDLRDYDPSDTGPLKKEDKPRATAALREGVQALAELQDRLYAHNRWSVLLIFQAMDAAGKDGVIKHVMSGINPQGCQVASFKAPSSLELDHDFLWRCCLHLPERGRIGIFNRSYYEEVLITRVHPELLNYQRLPEELVTRKLWKERFESIRDFETHLTRNGVVIRKFFLHVSRKEQKKRFLERIDTPEKNWKFAAADVKERAHWKDYMSAYQDMIRSTASESAPWYIVPADNKWYTRAVVSAAVTDAIGSLRIHYPRIGPEQQRVLAACRKTLMAE